MMPFIRSLPLLLILGVGILLVACQNGAEESTTPSSTPSRTASPTPSFTPTGTATHTPTRTPSPSPTAPPTNTATPSPSPTATLSSTPSPSPRPACVWQTSSGTQPELSARLLSELDDRGIRYTEAFISTFSEVCVDPATHTIRFNGAQETDLLLTLSAVSLTADAALGAQARQVGQVVQALVASGHPIHRISLRFTTDAYPLGQTLWFTHSDLQHLLAQDLDDASFFRQLEAQSYGP